MTPTARPSRRPWRRSVIAGLAGGAGVALLAVVNNLGNLDAAANGRVSVLSICALLLSGLAAGAFAARHRAGALRGAAAGVVAGGTGALVGAVALLAVAVVFIDTIHRHDRMRAGFAGSGAANFDRRIVADAAGASAMIVLVGMVGGALASTAGSLVRARL